MAKPSPALRGAPDDLPPGAESFIKGAARSTISDAPSASPAPPVEEASVDDVRLPWEGKDNKIRSSQHQLRLTEMEQVTTRWAVDNVPGARSIHQYILQALHEKLERDLTPMLGEKPVFTLPHAVPRSQSQA
ncbi:hypothetical protein LJR168_003837 [Pseudoxanthomonas sp. LjRoot168]|uniref:hypothetical protein n=1 Tax=unclassified Pseudoxanthomonas TaxID=2645906 RepID=UPI003ECE9B26